MATAYVEDGDTGCGAPGSLSWHKCQLAQRSHEEQLEYLDAMSEADRGSLLIDLVRENSDGNTQDTTNRT